MKRMALVIGLFLLLITPPLAGAATSEGHEKLPPGRTDMQDKSQEDDCDCCQKCQAARKTFHAEDDSDTGAEHSNGCEDCCDRCGRKLPSSPMDSPPDIIDKPEH